MTTFRFLFPIVAALLFLFGLFWLRDSGQPLLFWGYILCIPPLIAVAIDVIQKRALAERAPFLYTQNLYRLVVTLLMVFIPIPILFFLGPVGIVSIFLMSVDLVVGIIPALINGEPVHPMLCGMVGVEPRYCALTLWGYFASYFVLLFVVWKYGNTLYDFIIDFVFRHRPQ